MNDSPEIFITSTTNLDKNNLLFESNPSFSITYSDIDNEEIDLVFSASVNQSSVPTTFQSSGEGTGEITLDLTSISTAGYLPAEIIISDGNLTNSDTFTTWFIADKQIVTVAMDDDKSDGFDSGSTTNKDYYVYYLVGGGSSFGRTDYLFVADSLNKDPNDGTTSDTNNFRDALQNWQNEINDQGFIPENKIVESFWPNLIQPKTENVEFKMRDDGLYELTSITNGASIGYQIEDQIGTNSWSLYHKPILLGDKQKIVARAIRLGYKASEITSN